MTSATMIKVTLNAILEAFNHHDLDRIMTFFADECVLEMPRGPDLWGRRYEGKAAVREGLQSRFTGMPDVHYGDAQHFIDGETGITQWTVTGTMTTGQRIEVRGCDFYSFRDGRIVKKDSFWKIRE